MRLLISSAGILYAAWTLLCGYKIGFGAEDRYHDWALRWLSSALVLIVLGLLGAFLYGVNS